MAAKTPHRLLAGWCKKQGAGAITTIAKAAGITWAAAHRIVYYGAVPRYQTGRAIAELTGHSVDAIITEAERCRSSKAA